LIEIQDSPEIESKIRNLLETAEILEREADNAYEMLKSIRLYYGSFGKLLKRNKNCPYCIVIYEYR
jgi:hypothetical protein